MLEFDFEQRLLCTAIVVSVSPSWVKTAPGTPNSSSVNLQARAFAAAVMPAVNSHAFISPPPYYDMQALPIGKIQTIAFVYKLNKEILQIKQDEPKIDINFCLNLTITIDFRMCFCHY